MRSLILFFVVTFYSVCAVAQSTIPRSVLFQYPENTNVQLSPDGSMVAWTHTVDGEKQLLYSYVEVSMTKQPVKVNLEGELISWQWSHQNGMLVQTRKGDEYVLQHIFPTGKQTTVFTDPTPFRILTHSPQKKDQLVLLSSSPDTAKAGIILVNLNKLDFKQIHRVKDYTGFYSDGNYYLKALIKPNAQEGHDLYVINAGTVQLLHSYPFDISKDAGLPLNAVCGVKYDGSEMYFTDNSNTDKSVLMSYDFSTGKTKTIAENKNADLISVRTTFHPLTNEAQSIAYLFDKWGQIIIDKSLKKHFDFLDSLKKGDLRLLSQSMDQKRWLIRFDYGGPNEYYIYFPETKKLTKVVSEIPALDEYKFSYRSGIIVPTKDSLNLPCQLFLPVGSDKNNDGIPDKPLPTIIYNHGGPWFGFYQNNWLMNRHFQLLANRGYAVISVAFRGTTGFGKVFLEKSFGEWGGEMHNDILAVVDYAVKNKISDKKKIGIFGWSYGGYATGYAMGKSPNVFACGIDICGVNDLESMMQLRPTWYDWVGNPTTPAGKEKLKDHSPTSWISNIKNPLLVAHGGKDINVPQSQSDNFVTELKKQNKKVTYLVYPDEAHDFMKPETWDNFWNTGEKFLQENLGTKK